MGEEFKVVTDAKIIEQDGKKLLDIKDVKLFNSGINAFEVDTYVRITVEKRKKKRSNSQNSYYWGVIIPSFRKLFEEIGYILTLDETHEALKNRFLRVEVTDADGRPVSSYTNSTTKLSTMEFNEYIDQCLEFASTFFCYFIPLPSEVE